ncbi:MAG: hypothetical protein QOI35_2959, partial [Cryptosporangiaceae bacterium]|nr:hypothetical protein [Cryptosporangiaceae bacterium]
MERELAARPVAVDAAMPGGTTRRNPADGHASLRRSPILLAAAAFAALGPAAFAVALLAGVTLIPEPLPWIPIPVVAALSAIACYQVAREALLPEDVQRFWRHVGLAVALVGAGGTLQAADLLMGRPTEVLTPWTSAAYLASIGSFLWALFRLPVGVRNRPQRRTIWLDAWTVTVATGLFVYQLWIRTVIGAAVNAFQVWLSVLLLALVMVGILALTKITLTAAALLDRRALRALALSVLFSSICGSAEPLFTSHEHINIAIAVIPVAAALVGLAAELQRLAVRGDDVRTSTVVAPRPFSVLPYLAVAAADVLLLAVAARSGDRTNMLTIGSGVAMITGLVVLRQLTALRENAVLVRRLDVGLADIRTQERRFRSLVQNTSDLIAVAALDGTLTYVSPGIQRVLGASAEDWIGKSAWDAIHPDDRRPVRDQLRRIAAVPEATTAFQLRLAHRDGGWRWAEVICVNLQDEPGVSGIVFNARDVTESREFQERLRHAATHDSLTGLANRVLFADRVHRSVTTSTAGHQLSVVLIDLDNFKSINDTLGHTVGDALLVSAAQRLRSSLRLTDTVARLGGDEFAILLDGLG